MNVFILCTGRNGSTTIIEACKKINNFSCGHETLSNRIGFARLDYPDNHIEADNRLSWLLGTLEKKYGNNAIYIHLKRNKEKTAQSFLKRFHSKTSIINAFAKGILMNLPDKLDSSQMLNVCYHYVDTVNDNIEMFLNDKSNKLEMNLENIKEDFGKFWELIGAVGDFEAALKEFDIKHNASSRHSRKSKIISAFKNIFR